MRWLGTAELEKKIEIFFLIIIFFLETFQSQRRLQYSYRPRLKCFKENKKKYKNTKKIQKKFKKNSKKIQKKFKKNSV
jgi:hypothetical protein